ncbi:unnamed protein product, partial [Rotaria socialis]
SAAIRSTWHKWTYGSCSALIIGVLATFISGQITLARTVITTVTSHIAQTDRKPPVNRGSFLQKSVNRGYVSHFSDFTA